MADGRCNEPVDGRPDNAEWWDPCDRERDHCGPHTFPLVASSVVSGQSDNNTEEQQR